MSEPNRTFMNEKTAQEGFEEVVEKGGYNQKEKKGQSKKKVKHKMDSTSSRGD